MRNAVTNGLTGIGKNLLTLVLLIALMFMQDVKLASIVILVFPFAAVFVAWVGRRLRKISKNTQHETGSLMGILTQIFQGIRQVKAYNMEDFERQQAGTAINKVRDLVIKGVRVGTLSTPFNEMLVGIAVAGVIIYGGKQVVSGGLTVGQLTSFIAAFSLAYEPMKRLAKLNNTFQMGLGASERVFEMLDTVPQISEDQNAKELNVKKPKIVFKDVYFRYDDSEETILNGISFEMPAGSVTALVGPSGSGKTTILNLIPRFYDVDEGAVTISGKNVKDLTLRSLRDHIALVSQDIMIFRATARDNIAYGRKDAHEEDIIKAAKAAAAHDFIMDLPQGYDTELGEHGVKLSGGQKQRIAIARAVLRNAPILLLDEATSSLDTESEKIIQEALQKLQRGRTTLIIAHRLSTIQNADQIITLEKGHIVETGTHKDLLQEEGLYARMHNIQ
jgi:subfamily B ATP-binding cassette protein MsbA